MSRCEIQGLHCAFSLRSKFVCYACVLCSFLSNSCSDDEDQQASTATHSETLKSSSVMILRMGRNKEVLAKWIRNSEGLFDRWKRRGILRESYPKVVKAGDYGGKNLLRKASPKQSATMTLTDTDKKKETGDKTRLWLVAGACSQAQSAASLRFLQSYVREAQSVEVQTPVDVSTCPLRQITMVKVPAGTYRSGCASSSQNDCKTKPKARDIDVDVFEIDITETTVADYRQCVDAGACKEPSSHPPFSWKKPRHLDHPINGIDWHQAETYCQWQGKELPRVEEWEKAARGGGFLPYPWGKKEPECSRATYAGSSHPCRHSHSEAVAAHPEGKNPFGLWDMAGNVAEWVVGLQSADKKKKSPTESGLGMRQVRGGGWMDSGHALLIHQTRLVHSGARLADVGVRCVKRARLKAQAKPQTKFKSTQKEKSDTKKMKAVRYPPEDMVTIPGGVFYKGCYHTREAACFADSSPVTRVELNTFEIDRTEVRVADYRTCVEAEQCAEPLSGEGLNWGRKGFDKHPINGVSWKEARNYCAWLDKKLATEAEWEKAARGGKEVAHPWGKEKSTCAHAAMTDPSLGCSSVGTREAGSSPKGDSAYGVSDMAGNVMEWVEDWYHRDAYLRRASNARGSFSSLGGGLGKVFRGGAYSHSLADLRATKRWSQDPLAQLETVGFRCVKLH
jgi:formylglycine-generating enzyme required for sulfatase activity